jgi:hypothetical protein
VPNTWYDWSSSSGKKFWAGIILFITIFLVIIPMATGNGIFWANRLSSSGVTITTCAYSSGGPGSGCYNTPVVMKFALGDQWGTTNFGSSYTCRILSGGTSPPGATGPGSGSLAGTIMPGDSAITSSASACTTNSAYSPGQTLQVAISSSSTFAFTTTTFNFYTPILTVPFCTSSTGCQTSTTSVPIGLALTLTPSTAAEYNAANPNSVLIGLPNATSIGAPGTATINAYCTTGSTNKPLGGTSAGPFVLSFQAIVGGNAIATTPAAPFGAGYVSYTPLDLNQAGGSSTVGTLITAIQVEIKATTQSDVPLPQGGPLGTALLSKPGSVPDNIYAIQVPDTSATYVKVGGGGVNPSYQGSFSVSQAFACTNFVSGDVATITAIEYQNYSPTYVKANNGALNAQATAISATTTVLTVKF